MSLWKVRQLGQPVNMWVCVRQESWGLMSHSFVEWEQLSVNILVGIFSRVSCLIFWILLPFLLHVGSSTQTEDSYQKLSLSVDYHICVSKERLLKRKILFQSRVPERFPYFWPFVF